MKVHRVLLVCALAGLAVSCSGKNSARILLYGETHSNSAQQQLELEAWRDCYARGMRHLFVEYGYASAWILNQYLASDSEELLLEWYDNIEGTQAHAQSTLDFYRAIKAEFPKTIFHGIDVEHQYATTGRLCTERMERQGLSGSAEYALAQKSIGQGEQFYALLADAAYRENMMAANFIREFDALGTDERIMGIFGSAHTKIGSLDWTGTVPCMATQLDHHYKKQRRTLISVTDISEVMEEKEPLSTCEISVNGKTYAASYFGEQDMRGLIDGVDSRAFWRLEGASADFKKFRRQRQILPYNNYPTAVHTGDVFRIDLAMSDGSHTVMYFRSDGRRLKDYGQVTYLVLEANE